MAHYTYSNLLCAVEDLYPFVDNLDEEDRSKMDIIYKALRSLKLTAETKELHIIEKQMEAFMNDL